MSAGEPSAAGGIELSADAGGGDEIGGAEVTGGAEENGAADGGELAYGGAGWLPQPAATTTVMATKLSTLMPLDTPQPVVWLRGRRWFSYQVRR